MKLDWTRALPPALAAIGLLAGVVAAPGAVSANTPPAPAPDGAAVARAPGQEGASVGPELQAAIDAEIDAAMASPGYARLRSLVNGDQLPPRARATLARLLEHGIARVVPTAHACRRLLNAPDLNGQLEFAQRCRQWIARHDDGPLALATCRRLAHAGARIAGLDSLVARCRTLIAAHERDEHALRRTCARLARVSAGPASEDALAQRCRELGTRLEAEDASRLAACVRIARFAVDAREVIDRCRALLAAGPDVAAPAGSLPAGPGAGSAPHVGVETKTEEPRNLQGTAPSGAGARLPAQPAPTLADLWLELPVASATAVVP